MNKEDCAPESVLNGNDAFVTKILSTRPFGEQSSRHDYFSDKQSVVPFIWEEEPGIPKDQTPLNFDPPIIPPPTKLRPLQTQSKSCFFMKPWFLRTTKPNKKALMMLKGNQHDGDDDDEESIDESHIFSEDDLFSSPRVSNYSSFSSTTDSPASSKGFVLPSSRLLNFAKGIRKRLF